MPSLWYWYIWVICIHEFRRFLQFLCENWPNGIMFACPQTSISCRMFFVMWHRVFVCVEMHCFVQLWPWLFIDVVMQGKVKISRGFTLIHVLLTTALPPLCLLQSDPVQKVICSLISNQRCMHPIYTVSFVMHLKCADHSVALVLIKWPPSINFVFPPVQYFTG